MTCEQIKTWLDGKKTNITAVAGGLSALGHMLTQVLAWTDGKIDFTQLVDGFQSDLSIVWIAAIAVFARLGIKKVQDKKGA